MQLTIPSQFKFSDQPGTFTGYANVYNVEDLAGDTVAPGAFTKTIAERPRRWAAHGKRGGTARPRSD